MGVGSGRRVASGLTTCRHKAIKCPHISAIHSLVQLKLGTLMIDITAIDGCSYAPMSCDWRQLLLHVHCSSCCCAATTCFQCLVHPGCRCTGAAAL
jgi:hypothetical protein